MGEDRKTTGRRKRIVPKGQVQMIISREYIGTQTVAEAFVPIISEDIRKKIAEGDNVEAYIIINLSYSVTPTGGYFPSFGA